MLHAVYNSAGKYKDFTRTSFNHVSFILELISVNSIDKRTCTGPDTLNSQQVEYSKSLGHTRNVNLAVGGLRFLNKVCSRLCAYEGAHRAISHKGSGVDVWIRKVKRASSLVSSIWTRKMARRESFPQVESDGCDCNSCP